MNRQELLTSFYVQKDYNTLKQKLIRSKRADELEILAQIYLIEQNYSGARKIYEQLKNKYRIELDDREKVSPGYKFNDWEMRGVPLRIEMGPRDIENGICILVRRDTNEKIEVKLDELSSKIGEILELIQQNMFDTCKKRMEAKTTIAHNLEEFQANMNKEQGFIKAMWCGNEECEAKIKELTAAKSRCMPFEQEHLSDVCVCCGRPAKKMVYWGKAY